MTDGSFSLFGCFHVILMLGIPICSWILSRIALSFRHTTIPLRFLLGLILLINELVWQVYVIAQGWFSFPLNLPVHLCDVVLWLTVYACFTTSARIYDLIYYWGLAGTSMAVITPDISSPTLSYLTLRFFLSHGVTLIALLFLLWSGQCRPRKGSHWRAFGYLGLYTLLIGLFNHLFNTNYFYLCTKPAESSLLDYLGPWPVYLVVGAGLALLFFRLLSLPIRSQNRTA